VRHRTVEEVWFCLSGSGEMWRRLDAAEEIVQLVAGVAISISVGVAFQFRVIGDAPLVAVITTMPPWPGPDEAVAVTGRWEPRVA
jgi:mannose-6-phosphate isomerase-like protein (cupin superfamily)